MADVAADLKTWSTTASSNTPTGSTTIGTGLAPNLQEIQKVVRQDLAHKGADIASATTTDIGAVAGLMHDITGTTTITGLGTVSAGIWKVLKFEGVLTLTHNATSLILPGAANITTANGDVAIVISEGSGNWRCLSFVKASGAPVVDGFTAATQAEQETGTSTTVAVTPGRQQFHPSAAKGWSKAGVVGSSVADYNLTGVVDDGTGLITFTWNVDFSTANYVAVYSFQATAFNGSSRISAQAAGTTQIQVTDLAGVATDPVSHQIAVFGDQ